MKTIFFTLTLTLSTFQVLGQQTNETILIDGVTRTYIRYLPPGFSVSENLPIVFIMHGIGGTAQQMTAGGFNQIADTARIIVIYPQALISAVSNSSAWNCGVGLNTNVDDIGMFNSLMDVHLANFNGNASRIYATGFSMGSIMSHHLACNINNRIAAIGTMAGTMATSDIATCAPVYKTPVIHLHGTADATVPYYNANITALSNVAQTMDFWKNVHSCSNTFDSIRLPNTANDGFTVDRFIYNTCSPLNSLELYRLNGVGHVYLYQPMNDITEAKDIWRFFRQWELPLNLSINEKSESSNVQFYPNPSNGIVKVKGIDDGTFIQVKDLNGRLISTLQIENGELKVEKIQAGSYFLSNDSFLNLGKLVIE